jgi:hypothetical protein
MANPSPTDVLPDILASLGRWQNAYYLWTGVFVVLAVLAIVMPIIAAGFFSGDTSGPNEEAARRRRYKRIAIGVIGGAAAALLTGLRPNEYASGFDAAQATLGSAIVSFRLNTINTAQLASEYQRARNLTVFRYSWSLTPSASLPSQQQSQVPGSAPAPPHP